MYREHGHRAAFFLVYIREAHPTDGWRMGLNDRAGIEIRDPRTYGERVKVAAQACSALKLTLPALVDGMDNVVNRQYAAWPDRVYVVNVDGRIVVKAAPGPRGFPEGIRAAREWLETFSPKP